MRTEAETRLVQPPTVGWRLHRAPSAVSRGMVTVATTVAAVCGEPRHVGHHPRHVSRLPHLTFRRSRRCSHFIKEESEALSGSRARPRSRHQGRAEPGGIRAAVKALFSTLHWPLMLKSHGKPAGVGGAPARGAPGRHSYCGARFSEIKGRWGLCMLGTPMCLKASKLREDVLSSVVPGP